MAIDPPDTPEDLLRRTESGDREAAKALFPLVYDQLRGVAASLLHGDRPGHTWQPTELIHEAFVRLAGNSEGFADQRHFVRVAARAMRYALVDHARAAMRDKRGGGILPVTLDEQVAVISRDPSTMLAIEEALAQLADRDPNLAELVELRLFAGLSHDEVAAALDTSVRSVERGWRLARAWLVGQLEEQEES